VSEDAIATFGGDEYAAIGTVAQCISTGIGRDAVSIRLSLGSAGCVGAGT
jgi:hypothetical protein